VVAPCVTAYECGGGSLKPVVLIVPGTHAEQKAEEGAERREDKRESCRPGAEVTIKGLCSEEAVQRAQSGGDQDSCQRDQTNRSHDKSFDSSSNRSVIVRWANSTGRVRLSVVGYEVVTLQHHWAEHTHATTTLG
jgi:hypothetical protein